MTNTGQDDKKTFRRNEAASAPLAPGLYVVATPIGNLKDITFRALDVLARAGLVLCEDTRHTRRLLDHYGIDARCRPYHEHNAARERPRILAKLQEDASIALVSDAGTPLVSDPGYKLVAEAASRDIQVVPIPGPSSPIAALSAAGLPTDSFFFGGFLPAKAEARRLRIEVLKNVPATLALFETGKRLAASMGDMADILGERDVVIARELTKLHEEFRRAPLEVLARELEGEKPPKGEMVIVISPPQEEIPSVGEAQAILRAALGEGSLKDAVTEAMEATGLPRRDLYQMALAIQAEGAS